MGAWRKCQTLTTSIEMKTVWAMIVPKTGLMISDRDQVRNNLSDRTEAEQDFLDSDTNLHILQISSC